MIKNRVFKWLWNRKIKKINNVDCIINEKKVLFQLEEITEIEMIKISGVFHALKEKYPDIMIAVVASKKNSEYIKNNRYIDKIYLYSHNLKEIKKIQKSIEIEKYDARIDKEHARMMSQNHRPELYPIDHYIYRAQGYKSWLASKRMILKTVGNEIIIPKSEGIQDVIALIALADEIETESPLIEAIFEAFKEEKSSDKEDESGS